MVLLDTIDMLSPKYDKPQKLNKIKKLIKIKILILPLLVK